MEKNNENTEENTSMQTIDAYVTDETHMRLMIRLLSQGLIQNGWYGEEAITAILDYVYKNDKFFRDEWKNYHS